MSSVILRQVKLVTDMYWCVPGLHLGSQGSSTLTLVVACPLGDPLPTVASSSCLSSPPGRMPLVLRRGFLPIPTAPFAASPFFGPSPTESELLRLRLASLSSCSELLALLLSRTYMPSSTLVWHSCDFCAPSRGYICCPSMAGVTTFLRIGVSATAPAGVKPSLHVFAVVVRLAILASTLELLLSRLFDPSHKVSSRLTLKTSSSSSSMAPRGQLLSARAAAISSGTRYLPRPRDWGEVPSLLELG